MIRLDKYLADAGVGTRSEVKKYIQKGRVRIDGIPVKKPEEKVEPGKQTVTFDGEEILLETGFAYYILHKPAGFITATEDGKEKTVMDLLEVNHKGLFPVGRLDKDTEGLLLITDDGNLAHQLLSPKKHVWKTYYARVEGLLSEDAVKQVEAGIDIGDEKPTLPAELKILSIDKETKTCEIELRIAEGRYHQVKRMVQALGGEVVYLKRLSMGNLILPADLKKGEYRRLTEEEVGNIR